MQGWLPAASPGAHSGNGATGDRDRWRARTGAGEAGASAVGGLRSAGTRGSEGRSGGRCNSQWGTSVCAGRRTLAGGGGGRRTETETLRDRETDRDRDRLPQGTSWSWIMGSVGDSGVCGQGHGIQGHLIHPKNGPTVVWAPPGPRVQPTAPPCTDAACTLTSVAPEPRVPAGHPWHRSDSACAHGSPPEGAADLRGRGGGAGAQAGGETGESPPHYLPNRRSPKAGWGEAAAGGGEQRGRRGPESRGAGGAQPSLQGAAEREPEVLVGPMPLGPPPAAGPLLPPCLLPWTLLGWRKVLSGRASAPCFTPHH